MASVASGGKLQCQFCSKEFSRSGHLRRHERGHSAAKPFQCSVCPRAFGRRDALRRHESSHVDAPSLLQQGARACTHCAAAKTRCTGSNPCERCQSRNIACVYPQRQDTNTGSADLTTVQTDPPPIPGPSTALLTATLTAFDPSPNLVSQGAFNPINAGTNQMPGFPMHRLERGSSGEWNEDQFFTMNWLEEPMVPEMELLPPLPWSFQPPRAQLPSVTTATQNVYDVSPSQSGSFSQVAPTGSDHPSTDAHHDGPPSSEPDRSGKRSARGEFYVDGESARLPRMREKRRKTIAGDTLVPPSWNGSYSLRLADQAFPKLQQTFEMSEINYRTIVDLYGRLCLVNEHFRPTFDDHPLPSKHFLETLLFLFYEKSTLALPFIHWTRFKTSDRPYLLDVACIAIGSQYLGYGTFSASMHEFARRCLQLATEQDVSNLEQDDYTTAALLLNAIGLAYSGDKRLRTRALEAQARLKINFDSLGNRLRNHVPAVNEGHGTTTHKWHTWIDHESRIRLTFSIWLFDTLLGCHNVSVPLSDLKSLHFRLPSSDALWEAKSAEEWEALDPQSDSQSTLLDALQELYCSRTFSRRNHDFVCTLVIHGLFHRFWEVEKYFSATLSHWEPLPSRQGDTPSMPQQSPWLPAIPEIRNWQSSSCDALDVLHWQAIGKIGNMRGLEHPTVMHLHFARVVLLCPCEDILCLARGLTDPDASPSTKAQTERSMDLVRRWALYHPYKARLSMIHAGVIAWHIRRHGIDAFYETASTALSFLALWAFSMFAERKPAQTSAPASSQQPHAAGQPAQHPSPPQEDDGSEESSTEECNIILIDRPTDDELVQQFIRSGATMRPHMAGVGEIYSSSAPPLILEQGYKSLKAQECWGDRVRWMNLLRNLKDNSPLYMLPTG